MFQLTRPRGARRSPVSTYEKERSFNSRAREGRDIYVYDVTAGGWFQLTRPRGARQYRFYR